MIYVKKQLSEDVTAQIELTEDTKFYIGCAECGREIEATGEIIENFSELLFGGCAIFCEKCTAKRQAAQEN